MLVSLLVVLLARLLSTSKHYVAGGQIAVDDAGGVHAADCLADAMHQVVNWRGRGGEAGLGVGGGCRGRGRGRSGIERLVSLGFRGRGRGRSGIERLVSLGFEKVANRRARDPFRENPAGCFFFSRKW